MLLRPRGRKLLINGEPVQVGAKAGWAAPDAASDNGHASLGTVRRRVGPASYAAEADTALSRPPWPVPRAAGKAGNPTRDDSLGLL